MDANETLQDEYDIEIAKLLKPINSDEKEERVKEESIFLKVLFKENLNFPISFVFSSLPDISTRFL